MAAEGREVSEIQHADAYEVLQAALDFYGLEVLPKIRKQWEYYGHTADVAPKEFYDALRECGKALPALAKEARAFEKLRSESAKKLTKEEKIAAVVPFFRTLPDELKRKLLEELTQVYNEKRQTAQGDARGNVAMG